ncbi:hypothetical protein WISP_31894 [Willisornis vidua]|uniref:Uncharacterized protein n=1 Tax=Willisornis vidua TaxID=1566151 RepID=A0ABQ9DQ38_9PASS|nr:hypothetical protein WISP_31894 [Willisornis vidua]
MLHQSVLGERLTEVTATVLSVIFKEVLSDRKVANIAPSLKKDKEEDLGKVIQQFLLETLSKYIKIKKVIVNSECEVTMGKMSLTFCVAFSDGLAGCVAEQRWQELIPWSQGDLALAVLARLPCEALPLQEGPLVLPVRLSHLTWEKPKLSLGTLPPQRGQTHLGFACEIG